MSSYLLTLLVLPYVLWVLYIATMYVYRLHLTDELGRVAFWLSMPFIGLAFVVDWLANWTWAVMVFDEIPRSKFELVTDRLKRYLDEREPDAKGHTYRYRRAKVLCEAILDRFDPSGKHCS